MLDRRKANALKILVTGFDPFDAEVINASWEAVRRLPDAIHGAEISKVQIPTVFGRSAEVLRAALLAHDPQVVVCVGEAPGRSAVTPERVAINVDYASIADNDGAQPIDTPIRADGPPAYFSSLPVKAMASAIRRAGLPAAVSNTAGTYVCNHVMYELLFMIDREFSGRLGGFVHVPRVPGQVLDQERVHSLSADESARALTVALAAIVDYRNRPDERAIGGAIS